MPVSFDGEIQIEVFEAFDGVASVVKGHAVRIEKIGTSESSNEGFGLFETGRYFDFHGVKVPIMRRKNVVFGRISGFPFWVQIVQKVR